MKLIFSEKAWDDYLHWQRTDTTRLHKINELIRDIQRSGYKGLGKPEPLQHESTGYWSRRIDSEHRLIYRIAEGTIWIAQCRYHY